MIRRAALVRFDRVAESGRNKPVRVAVETEDGEEHEAFLKFSGRPELGVEGLVNELLAVMLAGDLGLPVNEPFLVDITEEWICLVNDAALAEVLRASAPVGFGSKAAGSQWKVWSAGDTIGDARVDGALAILAFDAYIENDDRKPTNSNCLIRGDEFRIIDHELAFRIRQKLFPRPEPWANGYLHRFVGPDGHIFGAKLKGKAINTQPIRMAWAGLSDARLEGYSYAIPEAWAEASQAVTAALTHLRNVRDRIDLCLAELERALT